MGWQALYQRLLTFPYYVCSSGLQKPYELQMIDYLGLL